MNSQLEELSVPSNDCIMNSITGTNQCLRTEKWQELASLDCSNKTMILSSSIRPLEGCGLSEFLGIKFICCPLKGNKKIINKRGERLILIGVFLDVYAKNDYETSLDEQDDNKLNEDDPIQELLIVPETSTTESHRKIIAMSLGSSKAEKNKFNIIIFSVCFLFLR